MSTIRPDAIDFRDRVYTPNLRALPAARNDKPYLSAAAVANVKDQKQTSACTGFALSAMVEILLTGTSRLQGIKPDPDLGCVSPFMPYHFARRYDDIPGDAADEGSTARAAMKAWHKHGVASTAKWPKLKRPQGRSWIDDAFQRPLGAYYRVDHTALADIHAALAETGVLYATAAIHDGWDKPGRDGHISYTSGAPSIGGHAFLIVGYDATGFWIQNSWGKAWGKKGFAHLGYGDWARHGWDLWVAQVGVQTSSFVGTVSSGLSLQHAAATNGAGRLLSTNEAIRAQQINPFVINLGNDGVLSDSGSYCTSPDDLRLLVSHYIPSAASDFGLSDDDPIHIAIYAHGGLTSEKGAAETAALWIPAIYRRKVFPLFIMWETGPIKTLENILAEAVRGTGRAAAGFFSNWVDDRLESLVSGVGTAFWDEMKENASAATLNPGGGLRQLYKVLVGDPKLLKRLRIHLIGHSAGACFHADLLPALLKAKLRVDGLYLMAPAVRLDVFDQKILPCYKSGKVPCYTQFHLTDSDEQNDNCGRIYRKSLLYLVSNAFERRRGTPILGMDKFVQPRPKKPKGVQDWHWIPSRTGALSPNASDASQHGGFSHDLPTMESILARIASRITKSKKTKR